MADFLDVALAKLRDMPRDEFLAKLKEHEFDFIDLRTLDVFSVVQSKEDGVVLVHSFIPEIKESCEEFSANDSWYQMSEAA